MLKSCVFYCLTFLFIPWVVIAGHGESTTTSLDTLNAKMELNYRGKIQANKEVDFQLKFTKNNKPLTGYQKMHKRYVHLMIVHENFNSIGHIHPRDFVSEDEMKISLKSGVFAFKYRFPETGKYVLIADLYITGQSYSAKKMLTIAGKDKFTPSMTDFSSEQALVSSKIALNEKMVEPIKMYLPEERKKAPYKVKIIHNDHLAAGEENSITLSFTENGLPLRSMSSYLGAPVHVLIIKEDLSRSMHLHGHTSKDSMNGSHKQEDSEFGSKLYLNVTFPEKGSYRMFVQARHGGLLLTAQFMLSVFEREKKSKQLFPKPEFSKKNGLWMTTIPIRESRALNPNQKHEVSFILEKGQRLRVNSMCSREVFYDLHMHPNGDKKKTVYLKQPKPSSFLQDTFDVKESQKVWVMWENKQNEPVQLQYEIHIEVP